MGLHISELGIKIIIYDDVMPNLMCKGYQYGSSDTFINDFGTDKMKGGLIMEILYGDKVSNAGVIFCKTYFTAEG